MDKLIRLPIVMERTSFSNSSVWDAVKKKKFPQPIKVSPRVTVWKESEIQRFIEDPAGYPNYLAEQESLSQNIA